MAMSDEEKSMLRTMEAVNILVETMLDKLETKNGKKYCNRIDKEGIWWQLKDRFFKFSIKIYVVGTY